jgi:hypothetical protein
VSASLAVPRRSRDPAAMDPGSPVLYRVARVGDEQWLVLPIDDPLPAGAVDIGRTGTHADCLRYLRDEHAHEPAAGPPVAHSRP